MEVTILQQADCFLSISHIPHFSFVFKYASFPPPPGRLSFVGLSGGLIYLLFLFLGTARYRSRKIFATKRFFCFRRNFETEKICSFVLLETITLKKTVGEQVGHAR